MQRAEPTSDAVTGATWLARVAPWARAAWLVQPVYLVAEVATAASTGTSYTLRDDTISALGTACDTADAGCSTTPALMNGVFILFGVLQAVGAVPWVMGRGRRAVVGWLWLVAGLASVGVGLLPVDRHPTAHALVALPVFVAQPLALLLHPRLVDALPLRRVGWCLAAVALVGVACFVALLGHDDWVGLAERTAIWPAKLWLPVVALATASWPRTPGAPPPGPRPDGTAPVTPPTAPGR